MKSPDLNSDGFIWSTAWQEAVLGHAFEDMRFALRCIDFLKPSWFTAGLMYQQVWTSYKEFHTRVGRLPAYTRSKDGNLIMELLDEPFFKELEVPEREKYKELLNRCISISIKAFPLDEIKKNLTGFARANLFKETMVGAGEQYKSRFYDNAYKWTKDRLEEVTKTDFEGDLLAMDLKSPGDWLFKEDKRKDQAISTGCACLDEALGGGLFKGETTAIMAPTNTGKTTAMITMVRHALVNNKRTLLITHEGRPEAIRLMILAALLGVPRRELASYWSQGGAARVMIEEAAKLMDQNLTFIPYTFTGKMYIENVTTEVIKRCENAKRNGEAQYELLVDDYPKKLKSKARSGSKDIAYRAELAEIYDQFNHLAAELNIHALVAIQTNREGSKQNRGKIESDTYLGMEQIDESFGVAQNMANIITLNRSDKDMHLNILSYNIAKSRNDQTDVVVRTRTDYASSLTHGDANMFIKYGRLFTHKGEYERIDLETQQPITVFPRASGLVAYFSETNYKEDSNKVNDILVGIEEGRIKTIQGKIDKNELNKIQEARQVQQIEAKPKPTEAIEVKSDMASDAQIQGSEIGKA